MLSSTDIIKVKFGQHKYVAVAARNINHQESWWTYQSQAHQIQHNNEVSGYLIYIVHGHKSSAVWIGQTKESIHMRSCMEKLEQHSHVWSTPSAVYTTNFRILSSRGGWKRSCCYLANLRMDVTLNSVHNHLKCWKFLFDVNSPMQEANMAQGYYTLAWSLIQVYMNRKLGPN